MSIRKRQWTTGKGLTKEAWVVDYADASGKRRLKTFPRKKEADTFAATAKVEVRAGVHVADSASMTVRDAGALWIESARADGLERVTVESYRQQLQKHIEPFIGGVRLSRLNAPAIRAFEDQLREAGRSASMVRRVRKTLGTLIADAQERGHATSNPVHELRARRKKRQKGARRERGSKLKVGVDIPTPAEVRRILNHAGDRWRPFLMTAALTGLRVSELRGLRWSDIDLTRRVLRVHQRADRYNEIGPPKSDAGEREIPLPAILVAELKAWRKVCPTGELGLAFPTGAGNIEGLGNIINRGLIPAQLAAGVTVPALDKKGKPRLDDKGRPMVRAKYTGIHSLRHFFASWCLNRPDDGGLGLTPKLLQERLGHQSIVMTMDVYGHLFPRGDDLTELDAAEAALLIGTQHKRDIGRKKPTKTIAKG